MTQFLDIIVFLKKKVFRIFFSGGGGEHFLT